MKKNSAKSAGKKKVNGSSKKSVKKSAKKSDKTAAALPERSRNPLYLLIIMGLLTVIVLMINRFYHKSLPVSVNDKNNLITTRDLLSGIKDEKKNY